MRAFALAAALLLLLGAPAARAGSSSVEIEGPARLEADGPATANLMVALVLDGVVCTGTADVPVELRILETSGVRSASLTWDSILFRIAGHQAATSPWRGEGEVGLRVWGQAPSGRVVVQASYALPPSCTALGGATSGTATHAVAIDGPKPPPQLPFEPRPEARPQAPPEPAPKAEPRASFRVDPAWVPALGALLGLAGGALAWERLRARRVGSKHVP